MKMILAAALTLSTAVLVACQGTVKQKAEHVENNTRTAINQTFNRGSAVVEFEPGTAILTENDRRELDALIKAARSESTLEGVDIAAWSDKKLPAANESLTSADRKLASQRIDVIQRYLKDNFDNLGDIDTFNMAEGTNWLSRAFNTDDAEVKEGPITENNLQVIRREGRPSTAVIVLELETVRM